jgi:hypothetical protein
MKKRCLGLGPEKLDPDWSKVNPIKAWCAKAPKRIGRSLQDL